MTAILEPRSAQVEEKVPEATPVPAPAAPPPAEVTPAPPRIRPVLSTRGIRLFGTAMIVLYAIGVAVQPAPDGPDPVAPWWDELIGTAILFGLVAVFVGSLSGRRWTLAAGLGVGSALLLGSLTCPLEGHHEIAAWWFVQMAVGAAMTVLPATLLRRTQSGSRAE